MDLNQRFIEYIKAESLFTPSDRLLLAVSGGVDSMVLAELCRHNGFTFEVAHCNFQLRGEESERDEAFVVDYCRQHQITLHTTRFEADGYAQEQHVSIQVAARDLRYGWFARLLGIAGSIFRNKSQVVVNGRPSNHLLLTAHHLDDSIETSLMNLARGAGISGIRGILPKQGSVVRPLLFARKKELLAFASISSIQWVEDRSNDTDHYSRNYIRHHVIPALSQVYPEAEQNLAGNLPRFRDVEILYQQAIDQHRSSLLKEHHNEWRIPVLKLLQATPLRTITYELIAPFGFTPAQVTDVVNLLHASTGKYVASPTHRVIRHRNWLVIASNEAMVADMFVIDHFGECSFSGGSIELEGSSAVKDIDRNAHIALLDAKDVRFPLVLRKWRSGDYFYPLGMKKKKKVARFLIDERMSKTEKESQWVLEMDKKILWVIGRRIDDRFKITANTGSVIRLSFTPY